MLGSRSMKYALLSSASLALTAGGVQAQAIPEIVVTATKRAANLQDVSVAVQAIDSDGIEQLGISNFDDYVKHLPNVTFAGRGPGQSTVFIRGMSVEPIGVQLSGTQGSTPNVALYLDEQPVTAPGRNLDVYATDLERIEVLPGPQGTLFGASSQAGTIRLITNKPVIDEFQAGFDAETSFTKSGEMSEGVEAYINIPVIEGTMAFRAAVYSIQNGGYIDNVAGETSLDPNINPLSTVAARDANGDLILNPDNTVQSTIDPANFTSATNGELVEEDFNDSFYRGIRLGVKIEPSDTWDAVVQHTRQSLGADGVFDYDPEVGDLQVSRFFPDELDDKFNQTSWTLNARLDLLDIVYTGAYLDREINQTIDYTGYINTGAFVAYYTCTYDAVRQCFDPTQGFVGFQEQSRHTQELRFSTDQGERLRATAGVFYDKFKIKAQDDFVYFSFDPTLLGFPAQNTPFNPAVVNNPDPRPVGVGFFNDVTRTEKQIAAFGEISYDITDAFSATFGVRYYDLELDFFGISDFAAGGGRDYDVSGGHTTEPLSSDDIILKGTLSYQPNDDMLFYATYSEGYRPGGWNRGGGLASRNPTFPTVETVYGTDDVQNYELGWKTTWLDGTLQFNGNAYYIDWTDIQVTRFDPQNVSILTFIENSADAEIFGVEGDVTWAMTENFTAFWAFTYNDTEVTAVNAQVIELAPEGSELPLAPEFQTTFRGRYAWSQADYDMFVQAGGQYASSSFSSLALAEREQQDSYFVADVSAGIAKDNWQATLFIENLTDKRAELNINNQDDIRRITTNRPRTIGLRLSYEY